MLVVLTLGAPGFSPNLDPDLDDALLDALDPADSEILPINFVFI
jgi:hypothetical protein